MSGSPGEATLAVRTSPAAGLRVGLVVLERVGSMGWKHHAPLLEDGYDPVRSNSRQPAAL
jgi:hypothetical protein